MYQEIKPPTRAAINATAIVAFFIEEAPRYIIVQIIAVETNM